jgi:Zn finger protein HypA/HybF involved in hydrogenase expression
MHEWGIATGIVEKIKTAADKNGLKKVVTAEIKLGTKLEIPVTEFIDCLTVLTKDNVLFNGCNFKVEHIESNLASLESIEGE